MQELTRINRNLQEFNSKTPEFNPKTPEFDPKSRFLGAILLAAILKVRHFTPPYTPLSRPTLPGSGIIIEVIVVLVVSLMINETTKMFGEYNLYSIIMFSNTYTLLSI